MRITDDVRTAIERAAHKYGSNTELGAAIGIHGATVGKWRNRIIQSIEDDVWDRLLPSIREFLPNYTVMTGVNQTPNPCDGVDRPPEFRRLCETWPNLSDEDRQAVLYVIRSALKKSGQVQAVPSGEFLAHHAAS